MTDLNLFLKKEFRQIACKDHTWPVLGCKGCFDGLLDTVRFYLLQEKARYESLVVDVAPGK